MANTKYFLLLLVATLSLFFSITTVESAIPPTKSFSTINVNNTDVNSDTYKDTLFFTSDDSILFNATDGILTLVDGQDFSYIGLDGFDYRKTITINHTMVSGNTTHQNFPILVSLHDDSDLNSDNVQSFGEDIRFTSDDGTLLNYEIESFINDNTAGNLTSWVLVPALPTDADTILYMYYSNPNVPDAQNPSELWDDSYKAVYHLNDYTDSTINAQHLTHFGYTSVPVKISNGQMYNGNATHYEIRNPFSGFPTDKITAEFWMSSTGDDGGIISYNILLNSNLDFLIRDQDNLTILVNNSKTYSSINLNDGNFHYIVVQWQSSDGTIFVYVDGELLYQTTGIKIGSTLVDGGSLVIGQEQTVFGGSFHTSNSYTGLLDEIRLSDNIKSADWIYTTYNTQNDPSLFYDITSQESNITYTKIVEFTPNLINFTINSPTSERLGGVYAQVCTGSQFMIGISNNGTILCASLP